MTMTGFVPLERPYIPAPPREPAAPLPALHRLKTLPGPFRAIRRGEKVHEYRRNDRDFQVGDYLLLQEWENGEYTGESLTVRVTYITRDEEWGGSAGFVCMSIIDLEKYLACTYIPDPIAVRVAMPHWRGVAGPHGSRR